MYQKGVVQLLQKQYTPGRKKDKEGNARKVTDEEASD